METVWWLLKQLYDKELLYKGYTIQPYSPKAGTGLSSHELNQPGTYRDVSDTTVVAQFKAKKETSELFNDVNGDVHVLAWTTTPWTLPSNTALAVGRDIEYVLVKTFNQYTFEPITIVLSRVLLPKVFGKKYAEGTDEDFAGYTAESKVIPFQVVKEFTGEKLAGTQYEQLIPWFTPDESPEKAFRVIIGDYRYRSYCAYIWCR
jgi:isoleucyl-tRNA synthetase